MKYYNYGKPKYIKQIIGNLLKITSVLDIYMLYNKSAKQNLTRF